MKFPYVQIDHDHYAPMVPVELWTGTRWLWVEAYVDSGASSSIFHSEVYDLIKPALQRGRRVTMALGDGRTISVNVHKVKVRFGGKIFMIPMGFSKRFWTRFNLLGRAGFFDRFHVCFDEHHKVMQAKQIQ